MVEKFTLIDDSSTFLASLLWLNFSILLNHRLRTLLSSYHLTQLEILSQNPVSYSPLHLKIKGDW